MRATTGIHATTDAASPIKKALARIPFLLQLLGGRKCANGDDPVNTKLFGGEGGLLTLLLDISPPPVYTGRCMSVFKKVCIKMYS